MDLPGYRFLPYASTLVLPRGIILACITGVPCQCYLSLPAAEPTSSRNDKRVCVRPPCGGCCDGVQIGAGKGAARQPTQDGHDIEKIVFGMHVKALLRKRYLTFKRDKKMWAFIVFMPALFVLIGVLILLSVGDENQPALNLTPMVSQSHIYTFVIEQPDGCIILVWIAPDSGDFLEGFLRSSCWCQFVASRLHGAPLSTRWVISVSCQVQRALNCSLNCSGKWNVHVDDCLFGCFARSSIALLDPWQQGRLSCWYPAKPFNYPVSARHCGVLHGAVKDYNRGDGAPLPYAVECTISNGTCDPPTLLDLIDDPASAQPIPLDLSNTEPDGAVAEASRPSFMAPCSAARTSRGSYVCPLCWRTMG